MKPYRGTLLVSALLLSTLPFFGCGNALEGGSNPSGSYIRVEKVENIPVTTEDTADAFVADLFLTPCSVDELGVITYEENAVSNHYAKVTLRNDSAPGSPTEVPTNSYVTMSRYRVDFTGLNKSVKLPSIDGGGQTVGIKPDGTGTMNVLVMDLATLEYIRSHYTTIGNTESLTLRATITIWGKDSFDVNVSTEVEITIVVDDYTTCSV